MKPTIVLDTNILISGYLWNGSPRNAIQLIKTGKFSLIYCKESLDELIRVLSTKFKLDAEEVFKIVRDIEHIGKSMSVKSKEQPIKDDLSDNLFVNLAVDGEAQIIVSGDSHLLKLKEYSGIKILTVAEFLKRNNE